MKKTTHNFHKPLRRALAMALALVMALSLAVQAFAAIGNWPATGDTTVDRYMQNSGTFYNGDTVIAPKYSNFGGFINVYGVPKGSAASAYVKTPTSVDFGDLKSSKNNTVDLELNRAYDFSEPIRYHVTSEDGRTFFAYAFAAEATGKDTWTEADTQELLGMAELFTNTFYQIYLEMDKIAASRTEVGSYHPANADMLSTLGYWLGMSTAYFDLDEGETSMNGNRLFDSYEDKWRIGGEDAVQFMREYLQRYVTKKGYSQVSPAALRIIYEKIVPEYLAYAEEYRITEPVIDRVTIGGSVGSINAEARTATVKLPKTADRSDLMAEVQVGVGLVANSVAGSVTQGSLAYQVTPYDPAYGTRYTALSETWRIIIETGEPDNLVTSFAVTTDGVTRYAKINETDHTISLNLPVGTGLSAITPVVAHTGTEVKINGVSFDGSGSFDFTNSETEPLTLTVTNSNFDLRTDYKVTITAQKSSENYITSYKMGDAEGVINGNNIAITIPYAMDLATVEPEIAVSEFAALTAPASLKEGENTYTVTSQGGAERVYTVTITRTPVATGNRILSFAYGSIAGAIDQVKGTITLALPAGSPVSFVPTITVSPFAEVTPASGEKQDFSKPVTYTVTSQAGYTNTYTITVSISQEPTENPHKADMESLVQKITTRYSRTTASAWEDWEWMNLGFYQHKLTNLDNGFSIAECIVRLDTTTNVAMTNIDRKIMTLTARGIDCSKLSQYNNGEPYVDAKGNKVDNLTEVLYNYRGGWTINGPIFALIALDMGNYTIPADAFWTRDKLLETILNHKYLSDGFGLDMVTMLMQSIGPYMDDPVYGERVRAKLDEGLEIVLDSFGSKNVYKNPYGVQWGGVYTSEGSAQIVCAMSAMGVDCHTDPRMSNGTQSALTALLDYADYSEGYFAHTNTTPKNALATYEGCYATQWYLGFLNNGGAGHPYSLYYRQFDFSRKLSTEAEIHSFTLEGKAGEFTTEGEDNIITVTLPTGTPLNDMHPQIELSEGAKILAPDLTNGITFVKNTKTGFTVQAEDGKTTKTYYVVVKLSDEVDPSGAEIYTDTITLKDANILRDLDILGKNITTGADSTDIELLIDAGKDTTNLMICARVSYGATATPSLDGKRGMDLSDWRTFTITSGDGTNARTYRIKATARTQASIAAFSLTIGGTVYDGVIDNKANTITVSGVDDSKLSSTSFAPDVTLGPETLVCSPAPGLAQDFSRTVQYIVAGDENVLSRTYTVSVLNKEGKLISASGSGGGGGSDPVTPAAGAKITAFSVLGVDGVINQSAGTITVTLPDGTDVTAVAPSVTVTAGAVVSPVSGEVVNLTAPVIYTVTLGEDTAAYTVTVKYERSVSQQLWDKLGDNTDVTDHQTSHTRRDWS